MEEESFINLNDHERKTSIREIGKIFRGSKRGTPQFEGKQEIAESLERRRNEEETREENRRDTRSVNNRAQEKKNWESAGDFDEFEVDKIVTVWPTTFKKEKRVL